MKQFSHGTLAKFLGGCNYDHILIKNQVYFVEKTLSEGHIILRGIHGKFNSECFEQTTK